MAAPVDQTALTLDQAADIWSILLGLAQEEEVDREPGIVVGEYTRNSVIETFLDYNARDRLTLVLAFHGVVGRLLRAVGMIIEDAMEEERTRPPYDAPEGDEHGLMQTSLVTTETDWVHFLLDLKAALEQMGSGTRRANVRVLIQWLAYRCANERDGCCLGHMPGRVADALALLTAALESTCVGDDECYEPHQGWCEIWYRRFALFVPTHPGSRKGQGLPQEPGDPMPVLFQKPLPDMESDAELPDHENGMRRLMRTNRRCDRDLDGLLEEEQLDREEEAEARAMLERQEEQACNEETQEMERQVAQWVQDSQEEREAARYQAWEDEVMRQAMEAPPTRKRTYVEVELSSGSSDGPRVSRVLRVPMEGKATLQLSLAVVQQEEPVATPPNPAAADTVQEDSSVTAAVGLQHGLEGHQGLGSPSDAETVLAGAPCLEAEQDGHGEEQSSKGSGVEKITYHVTDLTMQEYESLFAQWMGGTMTLGQIGEMYGEHVKELVQLQYVAMSGGLDTP